MRATLVPGVLSTQSFVVHEHHLVPALFPDEPLLTGMPPVLATPWLVAMVETAAIHALAPHLDDGEASVGARLHIDHTAPTPLGRTVTVTATCVSVDRRRVTFAATANDGEADIGAASHDRFVIDHQKFRAKLAAG
ncbi:MAG: thioesterase family protein [Pseudomonadota bacterium]